MEAGEPTHLVGGLTETLKAFEQEVKLSRSKAL